MDQNVINLALALVTNELIHNILEIKNIRSKVARLRAYIDKEDYKEFPINIDTRSKAYSLSLIGFVIPVGILFGLYSMVDISTENAFKLIIVLMVATYFITAFVVDKYHVEIERVTKKFKK